MKLEADWLHTPQTQALVKAFGDKVKEFRFVGGAVRDTLLGMEVGDVDVATTLTPEDVSELLEKSNIRVIPTGIKHGTVTALIDDKNFEITTLRRDVSCDGRHADVAFTDDWKVDAARRDFTINALYLSVEGELFDYFDGVEDARAGRVRFIGEAQERISEDYLRILRFFRFHAYYGKDEPDVDALDACHNLVAGLDTLSGERIQHEMLKILAAPDVFTILRRMRNTRILEHICGFRLTVETVIKNVSGDAKLCLVLLLLSAHIDPEEALEVLAERWKLSNEFKKWLSVLITHAEDMSVSMPLAHQKRLIRTLGADVFLSLIALEKIIEPEEDYRAMIEFAESWEVPVMPVNGNDLMALGVPEGKELGQLLQRLESLWEGSDYILTKESLLRIISR